MTAGSDTSRNVVSTGMMALFAHPAQHRKLIDDPSLVPGAVEEMLRWNPPIVYQRRTATKDTVLGGQEMPKGAKAAGYYGAGNRDPRVFENPETFDVTRRHNPHLTFGAGRHFCLGSHLARLELATMFTGLVTRLPDLEPTGPAVWHPLEDAPWSGRPHCRCGSPRAGRSASLPDENGRPHSPVGPAASTARNDARTSSRKMSGSSSAAKCPPRSVFA
ncbi:cytochrome P450 [Streptomyces sp. NPDC004227]